MMGAIDTRNM